MAKDFFDNVYDNKLLFDKKALYKNKDKKVTEIIKEKAKEKLSFSDEDFELLLKKARETPDQLFTEDEAKIINQKLRYLHFI